MQQVFMFFVLFSFFSCLSNILIWFSFFQHFFLFCCWFFVFFMVWEGEERCFFSIFFFSILFFVLCEGGEGFFLIFFVFSMFFWFSWPLLARTTFGPDRLLAQTTFFDQTVLCPNLCEPSLTPKNLGQWGCSSGQFVAHVFFGPWTSLRGTPALPKTTLCGSRCCCGVVCRCGVCSRFFVGASKIWALRRTPAPHFPSAGPPLPGPPKISPFFPLSRPHFRSFSLSLGVCSVEFWWCLKRQDPQMFTFGLSGCRVKPQRLLQNVKNNFTIDLAPP